MGIIVKSFWAKAVIEDQKLPKFISEELGTGRNPIVYSTAKETREAFGALRYNLALPDPG